jgi:hypothetical protein
MGIQKPVVNVRKAMLEGKPAHLLKTEELYELWMLRNNERYEQQQQAEVADKGIEYAKT